ncbi:hypothetical protein E4U17_006381 [Claviceps sp. LM77 group G4]|nr:hypothetical protein E4U17_006381 [Claviceps sp. LM77 group G4]KAG6069562.1 hypothetical protein E4U33_004735 [Claviceps sp. LM78 group G4]KAG6085260.1 hypothetical protein E4U16_006851 [Claviceps sp. LM84 group G4]
MIPQVLLALASASTAMAHFAVKFPSWRSDTLSKAGEEKYSQWTYPCAGVPYKAGNITDWPLEGGSLQLDLHHAWTYVFVNLGLGGNTTNFNVSLTPEFWNVTGKGVLCMDKLPIPKDVQSQVQDGGLASLQVVTVGAKGSALYNCADVRFKKDAKGPENCTTSSGMVVQSVKQQDSNASGNGTTGGNGTAGGGTKGSDGAAVGADLLALLTVMGLASAFAVGL